jgi:hypothetical protein
VARRRLHGRVTDEEATGKVVGEPAVAQVLLLGRGTAAAAYEWVYWVPPLWPLQRDVLVKHRTLFSKVVALLCTWL